MSKHKTAAEWGGRIRDGLKLTMVEVGELVADFAACEAERDDLRRKLEVAEREKNLAIVEAIGHEHSEGHLSDLVDDLRRKLGGECETCDGTGVMQVVDHVEAPDEKEILADAECAECNGTGKGWIAEVITEREDLRRKLADASLSNAQLRMMKKEDGYWLDIRGKPAALIFLGNKHGPIVTAALDAALALPVDGLAEEVRLALKDGEQACRIVADACEKEDEKPEAHDWRKAALRIDALLAKLGARP